MRGCSRLRVLSRRGFGGIGGALGVCGWRLGVRVRVLSVLVSKLGRSGLAG